MADNSSIPVAVGNETFANDDISGVKYPRIKATWGPDGTSNDTDIASGKPLPTQLRDSAGASLSDATGIKISTTQLSALGQATMAASQPVTLPSDSTGAYSSSANFVSGVITTAMTGTSPVTLLAAPASGLRNYITQITVSNAHATVGTDVNINDGSPGTTIYTIPAAANYGGAVVTFPTPLRQPTTATVITAVNVTTGASTKVSASGFKGA